MQFSYSRVGLYKQCPYRFKLSYIDQLDTIEDQDADNALTCGNSIHYAMETSPAEGVEKYYSCFNLINDKQVHEAMKIELLSKKVHDILNKVDIFAQEYLIDVPEFKGIVDLITKNPDGSIDVFDFKYSNNIDRYLESGQLHIYKYFLEKLGFTVNKLGFIFIPKTAIRQKKTETIQTFRKRLLETLDQMKINIVPVDYDFNKVQEFLDDCKVIELETDYPKNPSRLCDWCNFKAYCQEDQNYMLLPKNEKRKVNENSKIKLWIYGEPFVGKSYLANQFPDALFLNTDGNIKFIDSPFVAIKDDIKVSGRMKDKVFAWDTFKEAIDEIVAGEHEFKTIVVDLLDDTYEASRLKVYDKLGVEHEHDAGFGKGYDMVKTEFLPEIRRLTNTDYNIILISHEVTSEVIKKSGDKLTTIGTALPIKVSNKIAGMVDAVVRITSDRGERMMNFKNKSNVFGGGRLEFGVDAIPCSYENIKKLYEEVGNNNVISKSNDDVAGTNDNGEPPKKRARKAKN